MLKIRPCLITRAEMPLPHNDGLRHRVKRDISLSFFYIRSPKLRFLIIYIFGFTTETTAPLSLKDLEENI